MFAQVTELLTHGVSYLRRNPLFLVRAARNAARLEMTIPLDTLRWLIERRRPGKGPERIEVTAAPPGLGVGLTVDVFGTKLDVNVNVTVEDVASSGGGLQLTVRARDLSITAPPGSPAAMMVGSLDLSNPAGLLKMMPMRLDALVDAHSDTFVIDLMKIKPLAKNEVLARVLAVADGAAGIREIRTEEDLLVIGLVVRPAQVPAALMRLRG